MLNDYRYHGGQFSQSLVELAFSGSDVKSFLQNQSTYDIDKIQDGSFQLISFLDPQGRVECFGWLTLKNKKFSLLIPPAHVEQSLQRLNKFLISEDVDISDPLEKMVVFAFGSQLKGAGIKGILFDEEAYLLESLLPDLNMIPECDVLKWQALTGWPRFDGSDFSHEILNNLRLFDLTLVSNKGCYPGQETVSKIATRRGAAYSPVLIEVSSTASSGDIISFDKKIGTSAGSWEWEGKHYICASLLRDFRVEKMKIQFSIDGKELEGVVRYYPLIRGDAHSKAEDLYHKATDCFRDGDILKAEELFRLSIKIDPEFADAYESLGVMLGREERFQEAIDLMEQLSKVNPKSVLAHTNMSLYLMRMGKITEAEEQKSLATIKSFQSFGDEAKQKEAEAKRKDQQQQEWAQRESMFRQVLEIDPDDTLANYGLGSIAVEKSDWNVAREHLERVLKQDPKYSVAYLALGKALKGLGLRDEANAIWKEGIKISASKGDLMPANQMQQELSQ
jgi:Flp pilus assembly protein TadD